MVANISEIGAIHSPWTSVGSRSTCAGAAASGRHPRTGPGLPPDSGRGAGRGSGLLPRPGSCAATGAPSRTSPPSPTRSPEWRSARPVVARSGGAQAGRGARAVLPARHVVETAGRSRRRGRSWGGCRVRGDPPAWARPTAWAPSAAGRAAGSPEGSRSEAAENPCPVRRSRPVTWSSTPTPRVCTPCPCRPAPTTSASRRSASRP
jgi:hypothetical protein